MVCFLSTAKEMPWAKEKSWEKESQEDKGSSTFPYPPGFERRFSLLIPFKHKVHQLEEGGGNGSKVRESTEKNKQYMKYAFCGLKDNLQNQLRRKRQPKVLIMVLA